MWRKSLAICVVVAATGCSDGGGSLAPSGTSASLGSGSSAASPSVAAATPASTSGVTTGTGTGLVASTVNTAGGLVNGVTSTLANTTNGVTVATGTATPTGQPLLNGALLSTDGVVGTGTTGLLTASNTGPNGQTSSAAVNVPTPILANTQVLPSGANGGVLAQIGNGATTSGVTAPVTGLLNGVTGSTASTGTANGGLVSNVLGTVGVR